MENFKTSPKSAKEGEEKDLADFTSFSEGGNRKKSSEPARNNFFYRSPANRFEETDKKSPKINFNMLNN